MPIKRAEYQNTTFILIFEDILAKDLKISTAKIAYSKKWATLSKAINRNVGKGMLGVDDNIIIIDAYNNAGKWYLTKFIIIYYLFFLPNL